RANSSLLLCRARLCIPRREIAQHAAGMREHVFHVVPARAARIVRRSRRRCNPDVVARTSEAPADVYVLVVEKVALIESADFSKCGASKQHEHACYPVRRKRLAALFVVEMKVCAHELGREAAEG